MGRPVLGAGEIKRIGMSEYVVECYQSRKASNNWDRWVGDNGYAAELLAHAENLADGK